MKISNSVLAVLSASEIDGNTLKMKSGQLDRKLYVEVNKILAAMGGAWNKKAGGHVFSEPPTEKLEQVLLTGEILPPQNFGYFPTPQGLAQKAVMLADVQPGMLILEPSAGTGAIASEVKKAVGGDSVRCVELLPDNCKVLKEQAYDVVVQADFLTLKPVEMFDRVVMNPPFAKQADISHVEHAYKFLKPGGRLVAIMSSGVTFRENKKTVEFKDTLKPMFRVNPDGAFKESGTMVNTVMAIIDKPRAVA